MVEKWRAARLHALRAAGFEGCKLGGLQAWRAAGLQAWKAAGLQCDRAAGAAGLQGSRLAVGLQGWRASGLQGIRAATGPSQTMNFTNTTALVGVECKNTSNYGVLWPHGPPEAVFWCPKCELEQQYVTFSPTVPN